MSAKSIWENERGVFIKVIVKPNSKSREFIVEINDEAVFLNPSGPAREGKANTELIKKLAKMFGVTTSAIALVAGHKSREKILLVKGMTQEAVLQKLSVVI
jgi:uncharacterized protein (TIGR00251 family)